MTSVLWMMRLLVLLEIAGVAAVASWRMSRQPPPLPNLDRLDSLTATEFRQLRDEVKEESATDWQQLGDGYISSGFFPEAEFCYRQADAIEPGSYDLSLRWGVALDRLGRTSEAIEKYRRAAESGDEKQAAVCWYHVARCRLRETDVAGAERALRQAGDFPLARYQLAKLQVQTGRSAAALPALDRLLDEFPDALKLNQLRYRAETELGNPEAAALYRERADRSQDRLFLDSTVEFLGLLRTEYGLLRQQKRCLDRQRKAPGETNSGLVAQASRLQAGGTPAPQLEQAAECLRKTLEVEWDSSIAAELIRLELHLGRADEAMALIEHLIERAGLSPLSAEQRGDAFLLNGDAVKAARAWERAISMRQTARLHKKLAGFYAQRDPEKARIHRARAAHFLALDLFRADDVEAALEHLQEAVRLDEEHAHSWYYLGECHRARADADEAREAYRRCLEIDAHHGRALAALERLPHRHLGNM